MNPEDRLRSMLGKARGDDNVTHSKWDDFATSARRSLRIQRFATAGAALVLVGVLVVGGLAAFNNSGPEGQVPPVGSPSPDSSDVETPSPPPTDTIPSDFEEPPPDPDLLSNNLEIWMVASDGKTLVWGAAGLGTDRGSSISDSVAAVIELQLVGPLGAQQEFGETTAIPPGTELLGVQMIGGMPRIDLSEEFLGGDQSDLSQTLRIAQIVFQATQVEGVDQTQVWVEGKAIHGPQYRDDLGQFAPPIVVNEPKIGSEHTSPLVIEGTANVFEGTVQIELEIEKGQTSEVIGTFTTASCGSGCRGEFSETLKFNVDEPTDARLTLYEESAEDGSRLHEVTLPIRLLPGD